MGWPVPLATSFKVIGTACRSVTSGEGFADVSRHSRRFGAKALDELEHTGRNVDVEVNVS